MLFLRKWAIFIAWIISLLASSCCLYISDFLLYAPCALCWYRRVCMFPLVIILGIASFRGDRKIYIYTAPLAIIGALISIYQLLGTYFQWENLCSFGDCMGQGFKFFGKVDLSLTGLIAFSLIFFLLIISRKKK